MQPLRICLVGHSAAPKIKVAQYLSWTWGFTRFKLITGAIRSYNILNGMAEWKKLSTDQKREWYDAIYNANNQSFINYLNIRTAKSDKHIVVEDARFVSEVQTLQQMGFIIVRVIPTKGRERFSPRDTVNGTVILNESFPHSFNPPYNPFYQIAYEDFESMRGQVDQMLKSIAHNIWAQENLKFMLSGVYDDSAFDYRGLLLSGGPNEKKKRALHTSDDRGDQ